MLGTISFGYADPSRKPTYDAVLTNTGRMYWWMVETANDKLTASPITAHRHILTLLTSLKSPPFCRALAYQMCAKLTDDYASAKVCLDGAKQTCDDMINKLVGIEEFQGKTLKKEMEIVLGELERCMVVTVSMRAHLETWHTTPHTGASSTLGAWGGSIEKAYDGNHVPLRRQDGKKGEPMEVFFTTVDTEKIKLLDVIGASAEESHGMEDEDEDDEDDDEEDDDDAGEVLGQGFWDY